LRELDQTLADGTFTVRCITIGSQQKAEEYCARHSVVGYCIGDEDMRTYKAMGLDDYDLSRLQTDAALLERRAQNEVAGFRQDWDATKIEDAAQLPGAAFLDADGSVRWLYRGAHPGDLPPMGDMLRAAREAAEHPEGADDGSRNSGPPPSDAPRPPVSEPNYDTAEENHPIQLPDGAGA